MGRRGLLDTSVLIASRGGPPPRPSEVDELAISVVTLAELEMGVLRRVLEPNVRAARLATLSYVRETFEALEADAGVAHEFARIAAALRDEGRSLRVNDAWIAATALAHGAVLITADRDFHAIPDLEVLDLGH